MRLNIETDCWGSFFQAASPHLPIELKHYSMFIAKTSVTVIPGSMYHIKMRLSAYFTFVEILLSKWYTTKIPKVGHTVLLEVVEKTSGVVRKKRAVRKSLGSRK